jgi:hypothetical protein
MYICKCFIWMLHMFAMVFKKILSVFASVSYTYFEYFICFLLYVTTVSSGRFKSRSGVAPGMHVGSGRRLRGMSDVRVDADHYRCAPSRVRRARQRPDASALICSVTMCKNPHCLMRAAPGTVQCTVYTVGVCKLGLV